MQLVIAEKPSVAQSIAGVIGANERKDGYMEGNGYIVSWCVGHLVELAQPDAYFDAWKKWSYESLPMIREQWKHEVKKDTAAQYRVLKELMHEARVDSVVCATDAGREGELIFRLVYEMAGCNKPMKRLWISSMEESAIREGFAELKPGSDYDHLYESALCRQQADWLVGLNGTRLFTVLYGGKVLKVGRVQTPTLAMLVDRETKIMNFKKEAYYMAHIIGGGVDAVTDKINSKTEAENVANICAGGQALVTSVLKEEKSVAPPKLYDLTTLQRDANRLFGFTAKQTLEYTQSLYEKKLCTYPRTDSNYLTDDMGDTAASIVSLLCGKLPFMASAAYEQSISRVLNSKKVSDHHAIIPTMEIAKTDLTTLPESERNILILTGARLLMATAEPHVYEAVTAVFSCADHEFTARGKTVIAAGWKNIERLYRATLKKKPDSDDENELVLDVPDFTEGQTFENPAAKVTEHETTPPKPHNEASLLSAMERAGNEDTDPDAERRGLGTPATRAAVIEKLVGGGFVERKGKQLLPTKDGTNLVCVLPDSLTSPQLTAAWENNLTQIAKGNADPDTFMQGIETMAQELVKTYASVLGEKQELFKTEKTELGKCPRCKSPVYEGKKNYYCSNKECSFAMWKNDRFFEEWKTVFTPKIAAALLKSGKATVKKLYSPKTGKTYDGTVLLADTGGKYVNYKVTISKDKELE